ncbi:MAG: hypothetical protein M0027_16295 [Candidatus Dormibacteraeota bacterium]|nr:hypothetical protein [Candidatus Dormibacteraeota bacterium]
MECPTCHSDDTQAVPVAYHAGVSNIETTSHSGAKLGVGLVGGQLGVGVLGGGRTKTQGVSLTNQAQQLAPPEEMRPTYRLNRRWLWGILVLVVASLLSSISVILGIAVLLGFAVWLFSWRHSQSEKAKAYNRDVLPGLLARWNRSWFCRRCGCIFEATANSAF